jgi:hypothetical protein
VSRQSKQRKKAVIAKIATAQRRGGSKGPSGTDTKHGKVNSWARMGRKTAAFNNRSKHRSEE